MLTIRSEQLHTLWQARCRERALRLGRNARLAHATAAERNAALGLAVGWFANDGHALSCAEMLLTVPQWLVPAERPPTLARMLAPREIEPEARLASLRTLIALAGDARARLR